MLRRIGLFVSTIVVAGCVVGACFAALIPGVVALANAHHYTVERVTKLRQLAQKSVVYWADGSEMDELGLTDRENVKLSEVPDRLVDAVIAIEDRSFWTNDGIDLHAVLRAFVNNLVSGEIAQGGSTITQQLVKNRILSPKRDVNRKLKEIEDALRLNRRFSKSKILEEYLNTVYFGQNSYGVKSASERYFLTRDPGAPYPRGKHLDELTVGEAALLAGLIANPEGTNPFSNPARASQRRAEVLEAEVQQHFITRAEADAANAEPLPNVRPPDDLRPRSELTAEVQDRLLNDPRLGSSAMTICSRAD